MELQIVILNEMTLPRNINATCYFSYIRKPSLDMLVHAFKLEHSNKMSSKGHLLNRIDKGRSRLRAELSIKINFCKVA